MARFAFPVLLLLVVASGARAQAPDPDPDPRLKATLKPAELRRLNGLAKKWIAAELKWDDYPKLRKQRDTARGKFMAELAKKSKKKDALGNVGNLLAMFDSAFPYKKKSTYGLVKKYDEPPHYLLGPKPYDSKKKFPAVVVLPGWDAKKNAWMDPTAYLQNTWKLSADAKTRFAVLPVLRPGDDYNKAPADTDQGKIAEKARIKGVLGVFGEVQRSFRLDRRRMFLDCGDGACGFGLRLLTYFPSRFAGAILRAPVDPGKMPLHSLAGMPLLLLSTENSKANCDKIQAALAAINPESPVTITPLIENPARMAAEIDKWIAGKERPLYPQKVLLSPTHDAFHKAHWIEIVFCEPIDSIGPKERIYLEVSADRERNRITISSENVSDVGIYLNDFIVDLDKDVTFVINGEEIAGTRFQRNVTNLYEFMKNAYDTTAIYPVYRRFVIPKAVKKVEGEGKGEGK